MCVDDSCVRLLRTDVSISDTRRIVERSGREHPDSRKQPRPPPLKPSPIWLEVEIARSLVAQSGARIAASHELIRIAHLLITCRETRPHPFF
jgi:hypothetical protein